MTQIVTKQSLNALAALAFQGLRYENDERAHAATNIEESAECLYRLLADERNLDYTDKKHFIVANAFTDGMEFGLAVAAAIVSNGLDSNAVMEAVRAELRSPLRCWPEERLGEAA